MDTPSDGVEPSAKGSGLFATTHWSVVLAAGHGTDTLATEALERLCVAYWRPLYLFVRSSGYDEETAKDLTQAFFERLLEKDYVKDADAARGRFRTFLLAALKHFLANEWDRTKTVKRGGLCRFVPLETTIVEAELQRGAHRDFNPEQLFERRWAMALLDQAHQELKAEQVAGGKAALFSTLQVYLTGDNERPPDMNLAQRALEANDVRLAVSLLNKHRPGGKAENRNQKSEIDLRGWEWRYLWQLCQPDESVRLQTNSDSSGQMAITEDGKVMAVQTGGDKIALWNLTTKRLTTELPAPPTVEKLRLSPTGNLLAVCIRNARGEPALEVWDVPARKISRTLNLRSPVRSLAFSPDETLLAIFDNKGTVAVVDWAANHILTNLSVPPPRHGNAGVVDFSPDGSRLAIGEDYGRIRILNWRTGATVAMTNLIQTGEGVGALAFSPSSELLATGFGNAGTIRLWDASSGEPRGQWANPAGTIQALAFTPDGQRLASAGSDRTVRIWSVADQVELRCLRGHGSEGMALAFLPDGKTLASGCNESTVCFWDSTASNRPLTHASLVISIGLDSPSHLEAKNYAPGELAPGVVRRFGFAFTPDGRSFITSDPDGSLALWDTRWVQRKESLPALGSNHWGVALSPDGQWLAVGNASGKVHIWDWTQRSRVASFEVPFEWFGRLHFSRSGQFLWAITIFNDRAVHCKIWRTADWQEVPLAGIQADNISRLDFSPDDRLLAAGCTKGVVKLWDFPSGRNETTFTNHQQTVWTVVFSPDGRRLAAASWDGTVSLRDLFAHQELATLRGHSSLVWGAAFSPDGRRLATGGSGAREAVKLWDLATQRELLSLHGEGEFFDHVAFSPDGSSLVATSFGGIAHLWRAPSWEEIAAAEKARLAP